MKTHVLFFLLIFFPVLSYSQSTMDSVIITSYKDAIITDEINGMKITDSDTLYNMVEMKIHDLKERINYDERYPRIYLTNNSNSEFLEIWGAPDIGFRQFYTIGYTQGKECAYCDINIGKLPFGNLYVNNHIRLGDDIKSVWGKAHLNYFRRFKFNGIEYFYFEKGLKNEVPFVPKQIFYYKFKNSKLIEIGFGNGFEGVNPMFQDVIPKG